MKDVRSMTYDELADFAEHVRDLVYLDKLADAGPGPGEAGLQYNPDKELDGADFIDDMLKALQNWDLQPEFLGDEPVPPDPPGSKCHICGGPSH